MLTEHPVFKTVLFNGCSKMAGCKACEIMRNEAYFYVRRKDE